VTQDPSKFRVANARLLLGLFYEKVGADKTGVLYTLKDRDHEGYPSLYRLYMEMEDPLEHRFANTYLESWEHWVMLNECTWFKPFIERWRSELELKIKTKALLNIRLEAEAGTSNSYQANKFLLSGGWREKEDTPKGRRGRPSKSEILKAADELARDSSSILEDAKRLGIN
jgi:hypothetical protein